ncbi:hypothetical protein LSTR_LSTR002315 [Laodelphax striatellus]|uniref:Uncharacterized protein n=1 Tax=Laodelphax striatellus TaxID=195883 RepID=A0A482XFP5_LAOST|nr:hypothetical protein LSTR_LSTR002315 [Laodelphax striatellus]
MICRRFLVPGLSFCKQISLLKHAPCRTSVSKINALQSSSEVSIDGNIHAKYENHPNFKSLLSVANSYGLHRNFLVEAINSNENVLSIDPNRMDEVASQLTKFGFGINLIENFFTQYPEICKTPKERLNASLLLWSETKFGDNLLYAILNAHPELVDKFDSRSFERIRYLMPYLEKNKNIALAILNSPNVLFEAWDTLKAKLEYLNSINIMSEKIATSGGLGLTLDEIKTRFEFLKRAGVYKDVHPKKRMLNKLNPKIDKILSTSNEEFARNVARLSLAEFETFTELYERELEKEDYEDNEYDD